MLTTRCRTAARAFLYRAAIALMISVVGCEAMPTKDPSEKLEDREVSASRRVAAAEQLGPLETASDPQARWETYERIVWSDREPDALRLKLMRDMHAYNPARFWASADQNLVRISRWEVMQPVFDLAVEENRQVFVATLVRSYARPSQRYADRDRPEVAAIQKLMPGQPVSQSVWDVLISEDATLKPQHRVDAWVLLCRLETQQQLQQRLATLTPQQAQRSAMLSDLQAASEILDVLPSTREQVVALMRLRNDAAFWQTARQRASQLTPEQRRSLALRHLPLLVYTDSSETSPSPATLRHDLQTKLTNKRIVPREDAGGLQPRPSERFADYATSLPWGDLLGLNLILEYINQPAIQQQIFQQADADHADPQSEHGGVLTFNKGAIAFPPDLTGLDNRYVIPRRGVQRLQRELAHYHFQVQQHDHADFAGPGLGDIKFAERFGCHSLVFVFVDRDTINVDYYLGDRTIIDLGVISRR